MSGAGNVSCGSRRCRLPFFPVVGARRLAGEREEGRRKHDDDATINLRANDERVIVRVIDERADASERQPGRLPMARVTTLGSCGGRMWSAAAATATERRRRGGGVSRAA